MVKTKVKTNVKAVDKTIDTTKNTEEKRYAYVLGFIFFMVFLGHLVPLTYKVMLSATPYLFMVAMGVVYINFESKQKEILTMWVLGLFIFIFIAELIGTKTGLIFGRHSYTDILGFRLIGVSLLFMLNWAFVIWGSVLLANIFIKNKYLAAVTAGLITVVYALFLEPAATKLFYWSWINNVIPIKNYITWFFISAIASYIYIKLEIKTKAKLPVYYLAIQTLFFLLLIIFFR